MQIPAAVNEWNQNAGLRWLSVLKRPRNAPTEPVPLRKLMIAAPGPPLAGAA